MGNRLIMAASTQQQPDMAIIQPPRIDIAVGSFDSLVTDTVKESLRKTLQAYFSDAGYEVRADEYPGMGSASTGIQDLPMPPLGKAALWLWKVAMAKRRAAQQRSFDELFPEVKIHLIVNPDSEHKYGHGHNVFGGILAHLPRLHDRLQQEHPSRRYSFQVQAPASPDHQLQTAHLTDQDLKTPRLLKLIRRSANSTTKDRTHFRFNRFFPYMLEEDVPIDPSHTQHPGGMPPVG